VSINLIIIWFNPPNIPTIAESVTTAYTSKDLVKDEIRTKGAIFCHVKIIAHWAHSAIFMTWGNQK
jgi:hypothetical protein